jgi:hypothetical protein
MTPRFPVYIVSKGRADTRPTARALEAMRVPYHIIVEPQERDEYAAVIASERVLVLDPAYQERYDTCDQLGASKSRGPGAARNFAWAHALAQGAAWHWVMDDNIFKFYRLHQNTKIPFGDGSCLYIMEELSLRYENVSMAGPNYESFAPRRQHKPPITLNTRIYSCNLIRNDVPFRWRGRYNEDTILSLDMLKAGWCTIQFNAFLQNKVATQVMRGGNTADFYAKEGTEAKSRMLVEQHPDVATLAWRFNRKHHVVDYKRFSHNRLRLRAGVTAPTGTQDYGLRVVAAGEA